MNPRVIAVETLPDNMLEIIFKNEIKKHFDLKPYLHIGLFQELKNLSIFKTVIVKDGTITWNNGLDICPDTLYIEGIDQAD